MTDDRGCIVVILVSCRECKLAFNTFLVGTDVTTIQIFIERNHSANSGTLLVNALITILISRSKNGFIRYTYGPYDMGRVGTNMKK